VRVSQIGKRGLVFAFEDPYPTNVYVIIGDKQLFVCDTFCGPESMKDVADYLDKHGHKDLPAVVFNSHSHYDHIWGNSFFGNVLILSHHECPRLIEQEGPKALLDYQLHMEGDVELVLPNTTFSSRVLFAEEEVEFFHSPGHTVDSSSCYDHKDRILFVSDNIESPLPYLYQPDLQQYIDTLNGYLNRSWNFLVAGHDPVSGNDSLIHENRDYLIKLKDWTLLFSDLPERAHQQHLQNILFLAEMIEADTRSDKMVVHFEDAINHLKSINETARTKQLQHKLELVIRK